MRDFLDPIPPGEIIKEEYMIQALLWVPDIKES